MKKVLVVFMMFVMFLVVGCDDKNKVIDMSGNQQSQKELSKYSEADSYGEIIHKGDVAKKVSIRHMKMAENIYAIGIGTISDKRKEGVALVCDIRANAVGITYDIKNDDGYIPRGNLEISIMKYRPGVTDIREADEDQDPVFSTANGDTDFIDGLNKAASLPKDTVLAFVIDKSDQDGVYQGIAWSPLFTVEQLVKALPDTPSKCTGMQLNLNGEHLVVAEKPQ
jgi:hypothetical protein